jgi:hypothetical protein
MLKKNITNKNIPDTCCWFSIQWFASGWYLTRKRGRRQRPLFLWVGKSKKNNNRDIPFNTAMTRAMFEKLIKHWIDNDPRSKIRYGKLINNLDPSCHCHSNQNFLATGHLKISCQICHL